MKATAIALGLAVPLVLSAPFGHVVRGSLVQPAEAQSDAFDGHWVGSGRNAVAEAVSETWIDSTIGHTPNTSVSAAKGSANR